MDQNNIAVVQQLSTQVVRDLIAKNVIKVFKNVLVRSSPVWDFFDLLRYAISKETVNFVKCSRCQQVIKRNGKSTFSLLRHITRNHGNPGDNNNPATRNRPNSAFGRLFPEDRNVLADAACSFAALDCHSFRSIQGDGLNVLATTYASVHRRYTNAGLMDESESILPSRRTIKRKLTSVSAKYEARVAAKLKIVMQQRSTITIAADVWSAKYGSGSYLGMVAHFIEDNMNTISTMMVSHFKLNSTDHQAIRDATDEVLINKMQLTAQQRQNNICFVSDQGSNIGLAYSTDFVARRQNCAIHALHNIMERICNIDEKDNRDDYEGTYKPAAVVTKCAALVSHFRRGSLSHELKPKLTTYIRTRWGSVYQMLVRITLHWVQINDLLLSNKKTKFVEGLLKEDVDELIDFLKPLSLAIEQLEYSTEPTLHKVLPVYMQLRSHLVAQDHTEPFTLLSSQVKHRVMAYFDTKYELFANPFNYKVAMYLHPSTCNLNWIEDEPRRRMTKNLVMFYFFSRIFSIILVYIFRLKAKYKIFFK